MGLDEAGTLSRLNALRRGLIDPMIAVHAGRIVQLMGDGALVEFASAVDAVTCAMEIQRQLREQEAGSSEANPIQFRIGINVGDILIEGEDILGDGVNVAARIEGIAEPGGVSISEDTWRQVQGKVAANFKCPPACPAGGWGRIAPRYTRRWARWFQREHPKLQITGFLLLPNHILFPTARAFMRGSRGDSMADNVTITLTQLAASLAEEHQLTKRAGRELLDNLVSLITKHLKKGERIRIAGLGILQVKKRGARMGRNPGTGEAIQIKASKKVAFRASKELKEAI
jgi:nucleoid DNA-binding protein